MATLPWGGLPYPAAGPGSQGVSGGAGMGPARKRVFLLITDAGGGHRGTAESLLAAVKAAGLPWDLRIVNAYKEILKDAEFGQRFFRISGEDVYNFTLKNDMTAWVPAMREASFYLIRRQFQRASAAARSFFRRERPDLVVSLMPLVNDVFVSALEGGAPLGLLMTDLVDTRPAMWLTPAICRRAAFVGVGCPEAAGQAREAGVAGALLECGLVIHPGYFDPAVRSLSRREARRRLGLEPGTPTLLLMMGGYGSSALKRFARRLESLPRRVQLVASCGRNEALREGMKALAPRLRNRLVPLGFCSPLNLVMRAADLVVTKPGPASLLEAMAMGLPAVLDDFHTMPQEIPNVADVERRGLGWVLKDRADLPRLVGRLLDDPGDLEAMRGRYSALGLKDASGPVLAAMAGALGARQERSREARDPAPA